MLILTRRLGESLLLGPNIRITVVGIRGHQIRIGIDAPTSVRVHREELYERLQRDDKMRRALREYSLTADATAGKR
jgi:carbon storage regulator